MPERMEVAEQVYEGGTPSKIPTSAEANRDGHVSKRMGGESASPTNPEKVRAGKCKTKHACHSSDAPTGTEKHACCMAPDTRWKSIKY